MRVAVIAYMKVVERLSSAEHAYVMDAPAAGAAADDTPAGATSGAFTIPGMPGALRTTIDAKKLEHHLDWYAANGFQTMTLDELVDCKPDPGASGPKRLALTFDGGYSAHYSLVLPMLQKRRMRASFFVPREKIDNLGGLTKSELEIMAKWGMEIGVLTPPASDLLRMLPRQVNSELEDSRKTLEAIVGRRVGIAAMAARHVESPILRTLLAHEYRAVAISDVGNHGVRDGVFVVARYFYRKTINPDDWKNVARLSVSGPAKTFFQLRP